MRVITGSARGKRLETPRDDTVIRPTAEMVKEAVFSSIQFEIENSRVLDLFAGTGQMGIEALSRGARSAVFVDSTPSSVDLCRKNVVSCGFDGVSKIIRADYAAFLNGCTDIFDIVILDPPYYADIVNNALAMVSKKMSDCGIIICEHAADVEIDCPDGFTEKHKRYSRITVSTFRKEVIPL